MTTTEKFKAPNFNAMSSSVRDKYEEENREAQQEAYELFAKELIKKIGNGWELHFNAGRTVYEGYPFYGVWHVGYGSFGFALIKGLMKLHINFKHCLFTPERSGRMDISLYFDRSLDLYSNGYDKGGNRITISIQKSIERIVKEINTRIIDDCEELLPGFIEKRDEQYLKHSKLVWVAQRLRDLYPSFFKYEIYKETELDSSTLKIIPEFSRIDSSTDKHVEIEVDEARGRWNGEEIVPKDRLEDINLTIKNVDERTAKRILKAIYG